MICGEVSGLPLKSSRMPNFERSSKTLIPNRALLLAANRALLLAA